MSAAGSGFIKIFDSIHLYLIQIIIHMATKETKSVVAGALAVIVVVLLLNLLLGYSLELSAVSGVVAGVIVGLAVNKMLGG